MANYISIPSSLEGFINTSTRAVTTTTDRPMYLLEGSLAQDAERICPHCGSKVHIHDHHDTRLSHLPFGGILTTVSFSYDRYKCPQCSRYVYQDIPFKAQHHRITVEMEEYTGDLLAYGLTIKEVVMITGLGKNTVKDIDLQRLKDKYTTDGIHLKKPERQARFLGIDEFSLHEGHRYAVVIIDLETGHVLWLGHGKRKQVVFDFIDHVGEEWMDGVEAVASDMNGTFQQAFEERCPHIQQVFDHFHICKNFNDKVVAEVRKDEQRRLIAEGNTEAAKKLKRTKYILSASRRTLEKMDAEADKPVADKESLFRKPEEKKRKKGQLEKYQQLLDENELLFVMDLVKEKLEDAYTLDDEIKMSKEINEIIEICEETENKHFLWFSNMLLNHYEGIIAHATYRISSGKVEGINTKIKEIRRRSYGINDDDYFFLKIIDASRRDTSSLSKSPRIQD